MPNLSEIDMLERAREVLIGMEDGQEIRVESDDEWRASIKKHNEGEFAVAFVDHETGIISLRDASHILLEHGNCDLYLD